MSTSPTSEKKAKQSVAITGMGCMCAAGRDVSEVWESLIKVRVNCVQPPAWLFRTVLSYPVFAGPEQCITEKARDLLKVAAPDFSQESVSRTILLAVSAVTEALAQAGLNPETLRQKKVGIALGTTVGCTFHNEEYYKAWREGLSPDLEPVRYFLNGNVAAALHKILGTQGPTAVVTNACASGTDAIGLARDWIAGGQCDFAIAGGADELSRVAYNGFVSLMLSDTEPCRPFNADRQGLNLGEGAGIMVLEPLEKAEERGAGCLGWVRGYGSASDGYHPTAPHPEGRGLKNAFKTAMLDAVIDPNDIALINAHGTGTQANDVAETSALAAFFSGPETVPIVSTKGITGHTLGAAGGVEAVFTLLALRAGLTPGTVGCINPDPSFLLRPLIQGESKELHRNIGISQSLAFGGGNGVLVLEAAP